MAISLDNFSAWLASRAPRRKQFVLSRNNIYIFPSSAGLCFVLLMLLMLLTAINYQNSLVYALTFFLGALFFMSIWMCFLNLSGLKVESVDMGRVFEGEPNQYICRLSRARHLPAALKIGANKADACSVPHILEDTQDVSVIGHTEKRGRHKLDRLYIETRFPFGLVVAWTWLKIDLEVLVYPTPVKGIPDMSAGGEGELPDQASLIGDLNDIKAYQAGDASHRILWKKYAATDTLVVRHHEQTSFKPDWVRWENYQSASLEDKLRYLCFDVCHLSEAHRAFGFSIPGVSIEPGYGDVHKRKCLDALALFNG